MPAPQDLPYVDVAPSTTSPDETDTLRPGRRSRRARRGVAAPLRIAQSMGREAPVSMTLRLRFSSEVWVEVSDFRGRFWVRHDASLVDLVMKMQAGGYSVELPSNNRPSSAR